MKHSSVTPADYCTVCRCRTRRVIASGFDRCWAVWGEHSVGRLTHLTRWPAAETPEGGRLKSSSDEVSPRADAMATRRRLSYGRGGTRVNFAAHHPPNTTNTAPPESGVPRLVNFNWSACRFWWGAKKLCLRIPRPRVGRTWRPATCGKSWRVARVRAWWRGRNGGS